MNNHSICGTEYNLLDEIKEDLFPKPKRYCDECGKRLSAGNRRQMVIRHIQDGMSQQLFAGFELCKRCAKAAEDGQAPNIRKKAETAFLDSLECVGVMQ